jgi:hypothetical protein
MLNEYSACFYSVLEKKEKNIPMEYILIVSMREEERNKNGLKYIKCFSLS